MIKHWTLEEDEYLKSHRHLNNTEISLIIGRTKSSVDHRYRRLKINKYEPQNWVNKILYYELEVKTKNNKYYIKIDLENIDKVKIYRWCVSYGYAVSSTKPSIRMRQLLLNSKYVDHVNMDKLDNRLFNIRPCTNQQNQANVNKKKIYKYSKYKGVTKYRKTPHLWYARIRFDKKRIILGSFKTELDAAKAYDAKALELHGEFARLNFPQKTQLEVSK